MTRKALVVGASGIAGSAAISALLAGGWEVIGLARHPPRRPDLVPVAVDLQDPVAVRTALADLRPSHVFFTSWVRQATEAENIRVNGTIVRNVLDALRPARSLRHFALVTGLKHYLGPFESYGQGKLPQTPFREDQPRLELANFYYAQEDEVFAAAERDGFSWSVHRPHTIIGKAIGNAMNMGTTLAVYASICGATGRPFYFPGSPTQWESLTDMTDARILARHLIWAATTPAAENQAFNVVNGDVFRWKWMWQRIAEWFGIPAAPFDGTVRPLEQQTAADAGIWTTIAAERRLIEPNLGRLVSPWHTDADLGRPIEVLTDMSKSRALGFTDYEATDKAFFDLFAELRRDSLIP
ncbi:SDR family oxidoreductase [Bradyrhizobium tropiciagri]|uniref:SDR family oxidoreductase n=1 Tax=Bradyrhizobium tropiciagri TaxID=312253 RepID=UPI001BA86987|nr:SDR family oxidoreductase [Bradyrhizobium tropiciagri]MBR0870113.1 SDR family oxidoreductase [Bradyrhizobium tropiciagri]